MSDPTPSHEKPEPGDIEALAEAPEADRVEQSQVVRDTQRFDPRERRDDVPEADWYEQAITEELDDEDR